MITRNSQELLTTQALVNTDVRISNESRVAGVINNIETPSDVSEGSGGKFYC